MYGSGNNVNDNIRRWVLLYQDDEEMIDFLHSLGFNIIVGDTRQLLEYIREYNIEKPLNSFTNHRKDNEGLASLKEYEIPQNNDELITYQFEDYFLKYSPRWSHVYSHQIFKTHYFKDITNLLAAKKNIVVIGIRSAGKTTLMMQLLVDYESDNIPKHYMISPSLDKVKKYVKQLNGGASVLFVDDCFRDTEAIVLLLRTPNIQLICFDRDFNYEGQFHKLEERRF